jgi:hypothetical protein
MIKSTISLQDLRRRIYTKKKAELALRSWWCKGFGWKKWSSQSNITGESNSSAIGHINLGMKHIGKRSVGNPHAAFEEAGTGNVEWLRYCDTRRRKGE